LKSFEEYLKSNNILFGNTPNEPINDDADDISLFGEKNPFNSTAPNPATARMESQNN
jgi:hypothetical protein